MSNSKNLWTAQSGKLFSRQICSYVEQYLDMNSIKKGLFCFLIQLIIKILLCDMNIT